MKKIYPIHIVSLLFFLSCSPESTIDKASFELPKESTLKAEELFRISSPTEDTFFRYIRYIHVLSDGNLVVQNYPDQQLYEFSPEGELVQVIGRKGRGPGEFLETFTSFLGPGDSLHVYDFNNIRHQVLTRNSEGEWEFSRDRVFRLSMEEGMKVQVPDRVVISESGDTFGIFRRHPDTRDTLSGQYVYVSETDHNMEHTGSVMNLRLGSDLAIHREGSRSMTVINRSGFYNAFYNFDPDQQKVILVTNTSNEIISIDTSGNEQVIGHLPYERFPITAGNRKKSKANLNNHYLDMGEIIEEKLLPHEPYYRNVILHENQLWIHLSRSDPEKPNWIVTTLQGSVLQSFKGPAEISSVSINGDRMYGEEKTESGEVFLVGSELKQPGL